MEPGPLALGVWDSATGPPGSLDSALLLSASLGGTQHLFCPIVDDVNLQHLVEVMPARILPVFSYFFSLWVNERVPALKSQAGGRRARDCEGAVGVWEEDLKHLETRKRHCKKEGVVSLWSSAPGRPI